MPNLTRNYKGYSINCPPSSEDTRIYRQDVR